MFQEGNLSTLCHLDLKTYHLNILYNQIWTYHPKTSKMKSKDKIHKWSGMAH